ncbi:aminotransferase class I/II-fold pyridoxal phosphate-dependent enzyme [Miniphocaeibacter massiliensis]|uniref:aminotransferase class I/II-fold pyridoxal phosphate-dependent enzyme n=1 Tax=Miniphocaeibacter massiliensis TaxID=2041841 RepID=UPI000C1C4C81|nr:aminotransferase class I/II-fold pyridoxal phosphate-dependent enzyme [Miniphocaeibacter massiliensis]
MKKLQAPVLQGLLFKQKQAKYRFHMPGHKGKLLEIYKPLVENLLALDFTEINGTDDLYNATGILKEGLKLLTKDRKSKNSFYLTNGTTVGILASIIALTNNGDSILMAKDCHKSVYNAVELNKLNPIIIENEIAGSGLVYPINENTILKALEKNQGIKMVVFSRPNYYGLCNDIDNLSKYCTKNNIYLLIDEAHGSHFSYSSKLPKSAMELGAHISVNSFHKTMPAFTQSSVLNLNENLTDYECAKILNTVEKLQTSSPSYLLMSSIDIARAYMEEFGEEKLKALKENIEYFYSEIENLNWLKVPIYPTKYTKDYSRIILETKVPAINVQNYLEKNNIYIEMISKNILVLITSTEDTKEDFKYLAKILNEFEPNNINIIKKSENTSSNITPLDGELIELANSSGKTLKENIIIYPPGSVYLKSGDKISQKDITYINTLLESGINIYTDFNKNINFLYVAID